MIVTFSSRVGSLAGRVGTAVSIVLINSYRLLLAPLLLGGCRHWPTCSHYAEEAIRKHGLRHGWRLALGRLVRCRPGGTYGFDPVPDPAPSAHHSLTGRPPR